jgi:hypothetical protein
MKFDENFLNKYDLTVVIVEELHSEIRGYLIKNKEFRLKYPQPQKREAITLDGCVAEDNYYIVDADEYARVTGKYLGGSEVLIPVWAGRLSFRPKYLSVSQPRV